ncbi:MAG: TetR/AcrR family transcriptional regulator [Sphingobium sp.]
MPSNKTTAPSNPTSPPKRPVGRPSTRQKAEMEASSVDRRSLLLEVSGQLFAEFGFESTTVRQIADKVHLLPGSLYYYYPNKEDILHEIIREPVAKTARDNLRISALNLDAEHLLVANVIARIYRFIDSWAAFTILQNDRKFLSRHEDFQYVDAVKDRSIDLLQSTLHSGMESGLFRPDLDTSLMIGAISRMLNSAATLFRSGDIFSMEDAHTYSLDEVIDFYLDCILRMVRNPVRIETPIPRALCQDLMIDR